MAVNLSESICSGKSGLGAEISINRKLREDQILFGETQGVIVVSLEPKNLHNVALLADEYNVYTQTIGSVNDSSSLKINNSIDIDRKKIEKAYFHTLDSIMKD